MNLVCLYCKTAFEPKMEAGWFIKLKLCLLWAVAVHFPSLTTVISPNVPIDLALLTECPHRSGSSQNFPEVDSQYLLFGTGVEFSRGIPIARCNLCKGYCSSVAIFLLIVFSFVHGLLPCFGCYGQDSCGCADVSQMLAFMTQCFCTFIL